MSNYIAIDLDGQGLYTVAGAARGTVKLTHALPWSSDDGDAPPLLTQETAKAIGEQLRDKLRAAGAAPAPVLVTIGRDRVILKELKYPTVPATEEPALVRFQAMKEMSESPEDIVLDYTPLGDTNGERRSMAVVMRKELFSAIQSMTQAAGLRLTGVTPRPYAVAAGLTRALAAGAIPPPADSNEAVVGLTLSPAGGEFTVVRRGEVIFTLALPAPVVASESMLVAQIRRNLTIFSGQNPGTSIQAVYLAEVGGLWADRLSAALNIPVHAYDPLAGAVPELSDSLRGRFAGAVGLLAGRAANTLPINFAHPRQPRPSSDPAKRSLALIGIAAMLFVVVGVAIGALFVNRGSSTIQDLTKRRDELKQQLDKNGPDTKRLAAVDSWAKREVNWLDELYELSERMPKDDSVRVLSLDAKPMPVLKDGKQQGQASLDLKLATKSNNDGIGLGDSFIRANPTPNKYYLGTITTSGGANTGIYSGTHKFTVNIRTRVNHREPGEYVTNTRITPPKQTTGSTGIATLPPPSPAPVETVLAPPPREKTEDSVP